MTRSARAAAAPRRRERPLARWGWTVSRLAVAFFALDRAPKFARPQRAAVLRISRKGND